MLFDCLGTIGPNLFSKDIRAIMASLIIHFERLSMLFDDYWPKYGLGSGVSSLDNFEDLFAK